MKKHIFTISLSGLLLLGSCSELQEIASQIPTHESSAGVSNSKIAEGLKQALELGVQDGIQKLGKTDGFYGNQLTRILLPEELQKVDNTLRNIGLGSLADEGIKLLNKAAEDAVSEAAPIFISAIKNMTFTDAKEILFGANNAASLYLEDKTSTQLFNAFQPKIKNSLGKVGADKVWEQIFTNYNRLTGQKITTDLNSYVTEQAIDRVFKVVEEKENGIRENIGLRNTPLLKEVFGLLDKK